MKREFRQQVSARLEAAHVPTVLSPGQWEALSHYYELLQHWNEKVNLTALPIATLSSEAIDRLLVEPLVAAEFIEDGPV